LRVRPQRGGDGERCGCRGGPIVGGGGAGLSCHPGYRAGTGWDRRLRRNLKTQVRKSADHGSGEPGPALAGSPLASPGKLVLAHREQAVLGADSGQFSEVAFDLLPHPAERDAENTLAALQEIHHLIG